MDQGTRCWRIARATAAGLGLLALGFVPQAHAVGAKAIVELKLRDGTSLGRIDLTETTAGVLLRIKLKGLTPGGHGLHFHELGKCEGDFSSAGGILNPPQARHGLLNEEGPMVGDLPNLIVPVAGDVDVEVLSPFVTLARDSEESLLPAQGTSLVLRADLDDHRSQPDGNSGARVACGTVTAVKP